MKNRPNATPVSTDSKKDSTEKVLTSVLALFEQQPGDKSEQLQWLNSVNAWMDSVYVR